MRAVYGLVVSKGLLALKAKNTLTFLILFIPLLFTEEKPN
jgi:hypothetical protein